MYRPFIAALVLAGCTGGQSGTGASLRFGHVVRYATLDDFSAPIAVGVKMPIGVQGTQKPALLNDYPYVDATLTVTDASGAVVPTQRTEVGKFEAVFPTAGSYTVTATAQGAEDRVQVRARQLSSLEVAKATLLTTIPGAAGCTATVTPGSRVLLRANQRLALTVGARSAEGEPLLGVFDLDVAEAGADATAEGTLGAANTFRVSATSAGSVTFTERTTGRSVVQQLDFAAGDATCP